MATNAATNSEELNVQVMDLLAGVSTHGDQHLAEVERDLVQMNTLLDEAIKKLCSSFMAIHTAVGKQQEAIGSMLSADLSVTDYAARLEATQSEIKLHVGAAVTGLQFQDMTSQLMGRMAQHLTGLRDVFGEIDASDTTLLKSGHEALLEKMSLISGRVSARLSEHEDGVRKSVNQHHMESGDIELF